MNSILSQTLGINGYIILTAQIQYSIDADFGILRTFVMCCSLTSLTLIDRTVVFWQAADCSFGQHPIWCIHTMLRLFNEAFLRIHTELETIRTF